MIASTFIASGSYLPSKIVTNDDLAQTLDTNHAWISDRTGIHQRHMAAQNEQTSDLALKAAQKALDAAGLKPDDIDLVIVATCTPDLTFPSTAALLQKKLGMSNGAPAFDVNAVCSGFVYALSMMDALLKSGGYKRALVVGAEIFSRILDWNDRTTCILFGDGAGAMIFEAVQTQERTGILTSYIGADGRQEASLKCTGGVSLNQMSGVLTMKGGEVFRAAVEKMSHSVKKLLLAENLPLASVSYFVPHQANQRIIDFIAENLGIDQASIISTIKNHANTSAASIPLAFDDANRRGLFKKNDLIAMTALGAGFTWGSLLLKI